LEPLALYTTFFNDVYLLLFIEFTSRVNLRREQQATILTASGQTRRGLSTVWGMSGIDSLQLSKTFMVVTKKNDSQLPCS